MANDNLICSTYFFCSRRRKRRPTMNQKVRQKLLNGCMAAAVALCSTLIPMVANAATPSTASAVTRIGGYDQFETAALIAQKGWTGTSDRVVLSAGMTYNLVDALAAGPLAARLKAPIILTDGGQSLNVFAKAELERLKPKTVYITSGTAVIKPAVIEEIKLLGIPTVVPLGGYDQYETSINIAKEMALQGVNITKVMLAGGWASPADALSVAPIAAAQGIPILTTTQGQLPASVKTYLDSIKATVTESYVIGGTAVVSDVVKDQLPGKVSRYSGITKYDTNVQVLKSFAQDYKNDKVYVANGESLIDALAGVPLAAAEGAPVVLVSQVIDNATREFVKLNMSTDDMVVLGGEAVVSAAGMNALTSVVAYATDNATVGSTDATKPETLTDNVKIAGESVTLKNSKADYSVYVKGNNITLSNLTVKGTVFVDPGKTGSATLDGVTAGNIVILSGAPHSVIVTRSTVTGEIIVSTDGNTHVGLTSVTSKGVTVQKWMVTEKDEFGNIVETGNIEITSGEGNNLGDMTITSNSGTTNDVKLNGKFNTINAKGEGNITITSAVGTAVSSIISNSNALTVAGAGTYSAVVVQEGNRNVALGEGTKVTNITATSNSVILVPPSASIGSLVSTGPTAPAVYGGGPVNGQPTPITPPATVTPPTTVTPPATGSGGETTLTKLSVSSVEALYSGNISPQVNGNHFDFTGITDSVKFTGLKLTTNQPSPKIIITSVLTTGGVNLLSENIRATIESNGVVTTKALLPALDKGGDGISLGSLRAFKGLVFKGWIEKTGFTNSDELTFTIILGDPVN